MNALTGFDRIEDFIPALLHRFGSPFGVRLSPSHQRSDTDIAQSVELALKWHTSISPYPVRVVVDHGWVTLQGEVDWNFQRVAAESVTRTLKGVVGISNELKLKPKALAADVS